MAPLAFIAFGFDKGKKNARSYFMSERRETVEAWIASEDKDTPKSAKSAATEDEIEPAREVSPFERLGKQFLDSMTELDRLIPTTMAILPIAELIDMNVEFYEPIKAGSKKLSAANDFELYELSLGQFHLIDRALSDMKALRRGRRNLPGMFLMGLISSYDAFLAQLMHLTFLTQPGLISASEKNISFKDLVELGSIEAARNHIIEKEVETFLRQSHHSHFDQLEAKLKINLRKGLGIWPTFVEICERRNLFTHTRGVVSSQYLRVCAEHQSDVGEASIGDQLSISPKYLKRSTEVISELGLKLVQVIWRKLKPDETAAAASALNQTCFELLMRRRYRLAKVMLEFGLAQPKQGTESTRKMMVVNLAIATKQGGNRDNALKILEAEDWSATSDKFKICVAAVREEIGTVIELFPKVAGSGEISRAGFRDWPAFLSVKENSEFVRLFETTFGEPYLPDRSSSEELASTDQEGADAINNLRADDPVGVTGEKPGGHFECSLKKLAKSSR